MQALREAIDHAFLAAAGTLSHLVWIGLPAFWREGAHGWLVPLLLAAALTIGLLVRLGRPAWRERALLREISDGLARSDGHALVRLLFGTVVRVAPVTAAAVYLGAVPSRPVLLRAKQANPAVATQPDWEPEMRLDHARDETWVTGKGRHAVLSLPVPIDGRPLALVQLLIRAKDLRRVQARVGSLRTLLTPVLAQLVSLERIQRLEERATEASVVSGSSQRLLNVSLAPEELAHLLLDLITRSTGSDGGVVLAGGAAPRALAQVGLGPGPSPVTPAPAAERAARLRSEGFASVLEVPIGDASEPLGTIVLAKRAGGFRDNDARICRLNAARLALALKNRAYHEAVFEEYKDTLRTIVTTHEAANPFSVGHSGRIARLGALLARRLGLPDAEVAGVHLAGELHDLGMAGLGDDILQSAAQLTGPQYDLVKHHPVLGASLIAPIQLPIPIAPLVLHHHERYDGFGYPAGLKGPEIPIGARILALGEVFDALVTARSYRPEFEFAEAKRRLLALAGTQLDPSVVEAFDEVVTADQWQLLARGGED